MISRPVTNWYHALGRSQNMLPTSIALTKDFRQSLSKHSFSNVFLWLTFNPTYILTISLQFQHLRRYNFSSISTSEKLQFHFNSNIWEDDMWWLEEDKSRPVSRLQEHEKDIQRMAKCVSANKEVKEGNSYILSYIILKEDTSCRWWETLRGRTWEIGKV